MTEITDESKVVDIKSTIISAADQTAAKPSEFRYSLSRNFAIVVDDQVVSKAVKVLARFGGDVRATIVRHSDVSQNIPIFTDESIIEVPPQDTVKSISLSSGDYERRFELEFRTSHFETFVARAYADGDTVTLFKNEVDEVISLSQPWYKFLARKSELLAFLIPVAIFLAFYIYGDFFGIRNPNNESSDPKNWQMAVGLVAIVSPFFILSWLFKSIFPMSIFTFGKYRGKAKNLQTLHLIVLTAILLPTLFMYFGS